MRSLNEKYFVIGEDVIVINRQHQQFDQIGQVWKINRYTNPPTVSVSFEGQVYRFNMVDLVLA